MRFSANGKIIASASMDKSVGLVDVESSKILMRFKNGHKDCV